MFLLKTLLQCFDNLSLACIHIYFCHITHYIFVLLGENTITKRALSTPIEPILRLESWVT